MTRTWMTEVTLRGHGVMLEPLQLEHAAELTEVVRDGHLAHLWYTLVPSADTMAAYVEQATSARAEGQSLPFLIRTEADGRAVGSTRFCDIDPTNQRAEIGYTWLSGRAQRTSVNSACKLLLLDHAFEDRDAIAIEFRTHWHNRASRRAILRLGAKQDGVLRQHRKDPSGGYRDTVVFSILNSEWPAVKRGLCGALARHGDA